jgi:transposase-like protein
MYFHESEAIAHKHPPLKRVVEEIDGHLATIFNPAPLRPADFASVVGCGTNQVVSIFDLLVKDEVLLADGMVECDRCHNLMSALAYDEAMADEDSFECTSCHRQFRRRVRRTTAYRMTPETLQRPRPAAATAEIEDALIELVRSPFVFRRINQIWVLRFAGKSALMHDARGLYYIARLLAEPDRDVWASHLLAAAVGIDPRITAGSAEPLLDSTSMAAYHTQYRELQEDLEEARAMNDLGRIESIQVKLDFFATEISRATGLCGKKRQRSTIENVRKSVSMAVSRAIDSIRAEHEVLGKHLDGFINSGTAFKYAPDRECDWLT